jgi:hypothetical protein
MNALVVDFAALLSGLGRERRRLRVNCRHKLKARVQGNRPELMLRYRR